MSKILISDDSSCRRRTAPTGIIPVLLIVAFLTLLNVRIDGRLLFKWSSTTTKNNYPRTFLVGLSPSIVTNITTTGCKTLNQHAGVAASVSTPKDGEMWCVLDPNNTVQFKHFPHASQALLPCWSWFQRMRESGGSNMSCGFYVKPDLKVSRWPAELIAAHGMLGNIRTTPIYRQRQEEEQDDDFALRRGSRSRAYLVRETRRRNNPSISSARPTGVELSHGIEIFPVLSRSTSRRSRSSIVKVRDVL